MVVGEGCSHPASIGTQYYATIADVCYVAEIIHDENTNGTRPRSLDLLEGLRPLQCFGDEGRFCRLKPPGDGLLGVDRKRWVLYHEEVQLIPQEV